MVCLNETTPTKIWTHKKDSDFFVSIDAVNGPAPLVNSVPILNIQNIWKGKLLFEWDLNGLHKGVEIEFIKSTQRNLDAEDLVVGRDDCHIVLRGGFGFEQSVVRAALHLAAGLRVSNIKLGLVHACEHLLLFHLLGQQNKVEHVQLHHTFIVQWKKFLRGRIFLVLKLHKSEHPTRLLVS